MLIVRTEQRGTIQELQESHDRPRRPRSGCVRLDLSSSANLSEQKLVNKCRNLQSEPGFTCSTCAFVGQAVAVVSPHKSATGALRGQKDQRRRADKDVIDATATRVCALTLETRASKRDRAAPSRSSQNRLTRSPLTRCPPKPCIASRHYRQAGNPNSIQTKL